MMRAKLMILGTVAAVALSSTAAVASVVVVRSLGPSAKAYPPGKTLPESASISLKGGDVVTLLGPSSAQTLRGPGNFPAKQVSSASSAGKRGRFGALRALEVAKKPGLWDLDVTQSGKLCVTDRSKLTLWRPDTSGAMKLNISSPDGRSHEVQWASGKPSAAWPSTLPIANSAEYQITWPGTGDKSSVSFVTVNAKPTDLQSAAQVLIQTGCENQLDRLG